MMESVAAVVVTYNSVPTIARCITSLKKNGVSLIIVIDNASTDNTVAVAQSLEVTVIANQQNVGFAAACNQGWQQVATPYVLFLNPDAELQTDAITKATEIFKNNASLGAVGLQLMDAAGQPEPYSWGEIVTPWTFWTRRWRPASSQPDAPLQLCGWVSGGAMIARRAALVAVQGFDPHFFMYWEDVDLGRRLRATGWLVAHLTPARVTHRRGASLGDQAQKTRIYDQSADRYWRKHYATPIWLGQRLARLLYRWWSPRVA